MLELGGVLELALPACWQVLVCGDWSMKERYAASYVFLPLEMVLGMTNKYNCLSICLSCVIRDHACRAQTPVWSYSPKSTIIFFEVSWYAALDRRGGSAEISQYQRFL